MSNERNATPIDDQLIVITAIARAAGYDDGAAWIEKQATAFVERKLADASRDGAELRALWNAVRSPNEREAEIHLRAADARPESFDVIHRIADAEKRVKDAQEIPKHGHDYAQQMGFSLQRREDRRIYVYRADGTFAYSGEPYYLAVAAARGEDAKASNSDLTRKLAAALKALKWYANAEYNSRTDSDVQLQSMADYTLIDLAAIDAPAGEETVANGRGVSITPLPPSDQMCDFTYWATVPPGITKPMSRCVNLKPCALHPITPSPEPANAQASANGAHPFGACCPMKAPPFCSCPCHTNPVAEPVSNVLLDALTEPANAQGSEGTSQKLCAYNGCSNPIPDDQDFCGRRNCGSIASRHRDDALERAAQDALKLLNDVFDFGTFKTEKTEAVIANLRSVLAQRAAKGKQ